MKIADVRAHVLRSPLAQPFAFSQGWVASRGATIVEVTTDEGVTGWGEALCQGLQPPEIAAATVLAALKPLAIGADPLQPEVLWHRMYHQTRDYGMKGAVIGAISGVDIALWDILGKVRGEPVAKLLGGMFRDEVQAYATGFYRISGRGEAPRLAQEAVMQYEARAARAGRAPGARVARRQALDARAARRGALVRRPTPARRATRDKCHAGGSWPVVRRRDP